MCGICGILYFDRQRHVEPSTLLEMNRQIRHRGPDDEGSYVSGNIGLAMRRLSIIDVQSGRQPITNEDGTVWLVYNGEIYNHQELRTTLQARGHHYKSRTDSETIVHLYEEYGPQCVQHLRGMFAFVIWDQRRRCLFAARDRLGIKPFYYWLDGDRFLFGSEIKALLAYPNMTAELNRAALSEYLAFGYLAGQETMFSGIRKLLPGHTLELDERGALKITPYWDLQVEANTTELPKRHYVEAYRELLQEAVSSHLMSDVPLGVFLSGGLDSSAVAALTTKVRREPIDTFSVGYAEDKYSELPYAQAVAKHLKSRHHEVKLSRQEFFRSLPKLIWHEDEPLVWPSSISLYYVARLAREHVTVVLTGEGSDETLAGYSRYPWTMWNSRMERVYRRLSSAGLREAVRKQIGAGRLKGGLRRRLEHTFLARDGHSWTSFYFDNFYAAFSEHEQGDLLTNEIREHAGAPYAGSMAYWDGSSGDLLSRLLYTDIKTYLVELLMKQDNMSMAASVESRVPFLDHKLVEFASRIPPSYEIQGLAGKQILKSAMRGFLPDSIVYRKKLGFPTPWAGWLRDPQLGDLERMLTEERAITRGLCRQQAVRQLFSEHRTGHRDHSTRIWRLLNLEVWHRVFIDHDHSMLEDDPVQPTASVLLSSP